MHWFYALKQAQCLTYINQHGWYVRCRYSCFNGDVTSHYWKERKCPIVYSRIQHTSVPDPWHFGMDPDPRVWILGSVHLTNGSGSGSGSGSFRQWLSRCRNKKYFFLKVFMLISFWRYIHIILQRYKIIKTSQNVEIKGFLFFCSLM